MFPFSYFRTLFDFLFKVLEYVDIEFITMMYLSLVVSVSRSVMPDCLHPMYCM